MISADDEIARGERFAFGANWQRFLTLLDDERIEQAQAALRMMLKVDSLAGRRFLDIGSGSGLSSLAARRLGATVHSFDFDPQSVACTQELKRTYFPGDAGWRIEEGSALDRDYLASLGTFDVVYSWGVLHHTGSMWVAMENAIARVAPQGVLFVAIYNDQGLKSHLWWLIKWVYNRLPRFLRPAFAAIVSALTHVALLIKYTLMMRPMKAITPLLQRRRARGMSAKYDRVDWIGGFPFEFASFDALLAYLEARGFALINGRRDGSLGCNELAMRRI